MKGENKRDSIGKTKRTYPFSEESAGDDKCDVDGVTAHDDSVETFEQASLTSLRSVVHGDS